MSQRDYYDVLGVQKGASGDEIKSAYRKLAMQYHPDRNPGDASAEDKFKEAAEAYDVLSDADKKARYDRYGHQGVHGSQGGHQYTNAEDIFSAFGDIFGQQFGDIFGGSSRSRSGRKRDRGEQGADIRVRMPLTLEEIATGVDKTIKLKHYKQCSPCSGKGAKPGTSFGKCNVCNGSGELRQVSRSVFGQFVNVAACANCGGTGEVIAEPCPTCGGEGRVEGESTVKVTIPAGVSTGNYLTVTGKGHSGRRGGSAGDAQVVIEEKEHEIFERNGNDVIMNLTVDFPTAALGGDVDVPTLTGEATLTIQPGTQPGSVLRMKQRGLPQLNSKIKGDQLIRFTVYVPQKLSSEERKTLEDLSSSNNFKPDAKSASFFDRIKEAFS
jgi:molecular chaperone DnaJ